MEIDITEMFKDRDYMINLSGSQMEHGQDAGRITWNNSKEYANDNPILKTQEEFDAAIEYFQGFGAWEDEELEAMRENGELGALAIQDVAGSIRELEHSAINDEGEWDWDAAEKAMEKGECSGSIYRGDNGRIYFYMGA